MAARLTKIDALTLPDHRYLAAEDECYYLGEYSARKGYAYSQTNDLIQNFKKPVSRRDLPEYRYKLLAVDRAGAALRESLREEFLRVATLVPIPPSKARDDALYDDRLLRLLHALGQSLDVDIRELVIQTDSTEAFHDSVSRPTPDFLVSRYSIDESLTDPEPSIIALFDDVLTTGAHFRAATRVLRGRFPDVPLVGIFLARCAPDPSA